MFMVTLRALLVAMLVAVVCVAVLLAGHSARATVRQNATAQTPPARFLLFTSQRSGSTWFCDVLARQPGVVCGAPNNNKRATLSVYVSELLIKYSFIRKNTSRVVTWKEFHGSLEHAFTLTAEALTQKGTEPKLAHGFKLMYDQVPDNLVEPFVAWLRENHVAVLHLVREALPLRISSMMQRMGEGWHSEDAQAAALSRQTHPLLDVGLDEILPKLITFKELNERWTRQLRLVDGVPYLYVPYESLTGPDVLRYLQASIGLLGPAGVHLDLRSLSSRGVLQQLHRSSCRDRLSQQLYAAMDAEPFLAASMAVCRILDARPPEL